MICLPELFLNMQMCELFSDSNGQTDTMSILATVFDFTRVLL